MKILKILLVFLLVMVLMGACTFWLRAKWNREYEQDELYKRSSELYEKIEREFSKRRERKTSVRPNRQRP